MKKKICALMLTFLMMFAFSVNCLAWVSPTQTAVPTKENGGGNGGGGKDRTAAGDLQPGRPRAALFLPEKDPLRRRAERHCAASAEGRGTLRSGSR